MVGNVVNEKTIQWCCENISDRNDLKERLTNIFKTFDVVRKFFDESENIPQIRTFLILPWKNLLYRNRISSLTEKRK